MNAGSPRHRRDPEDRSVRRTWWLLSGTFLLLAAITVVHALAVPDVLAWVAAVVVGVAAVAAIAHRNAVVALEVRGRAEAENFARILSGLSRSVSVDAIVGAIVEDLADGTGADHVVIVRRRPEGGVLEATLVSSRAGVPDSTTVLPLGDLDLVGPRPPAPPVAVPIRPDADAGLPLVAVGAAERAAVSAYAGAATVASARIGSPPTLAAGDRPLPAEAQLRRPASSPRGPERRRTARAGGGRRLGDRAARGLEDLSSRLRTWIGELLEDFGLSGAGRTRGPLLVPRAEVVGTGVPSQIAARIAERVRAVYGLSHTLAAPLRTELGVIGAIVVSRRDREAWDVPARRLLEGAAVEASAALARAYSYHEATANAATDPLTGLPNRRYFDEFCALLARRRRSGDAVAVLMVDIDHFKILNDRYGHPVGDEVLKAVAGAIVAAVREEDVPARVGGEEFAVLLRNPGPEVAAEVGERVRSAVRELDLQELGVPGVSVSVGVANARGSDEPIPEIVDRADQALFRAKRAGRDRVVAA